MLKRSQLNHKSDKFKKEGSELLRISDQDCFQIIYSVLVDKYFSVGRTQNFLQGNTLQELKVYPGLSYVKTAHCNQKRKRTQ